MRWRSFGHGGVTMVLAGLIGQAGCHDAAHHWVLTDVAVSLPEMRPDQRILERAGGPAELLAVTPGGSQTLLVASRTHDNPAVFDDESCCTMVVVLDGPPAKGTYEVSPDNGRLILSSAWLPARRPYVELEGKVKVLKVEPDRVLVECALRSYVTRADEKPEVLRGWYWFQRAAGGEAALRQAGIALDGSAQSQPSP